MLKKKKKNENKKIIPILLFNSMKYINIFLAKKLKFFLFKSESLSKKNYIY
jgi:hypothetical protein